MKGVSVRPRLLSGEDLPPAPRQERSRIKRAQVLNAALALFGENGYEATSINEITARAGVAIGSFYQQFRSKRQLLLVLMDELLDGLSRLELRPNGAGDIRAGLHALLKGAFATELTYASAYRAWQEAALLDSTLGGHEKRIENWTQARVAAVFELLLQLPAARQGVNVPVLARLMDRFFWDLLGQAPRLPAAELDAILESTTDLIYHALFTDSAPMVNSKS